MTHEHTWFVCEMCGPAVLCGKCGNNCCNGGHGTLPDGSECDACPSAYEMQAKGAAQAIVTPAGAGPASGLHPSGFDPTIAGER